MNPWYVFDTSSVDLVGLDAVVLKNYLLLHIKSLANDMKSFKTSLKRFLYHHYFYSIEEYYKYNDDKVM